MPQPGSIIIASAARSGLALLMTLLWTMAWSLATLESVVHSHLHHHHQHGLSQRGTAHTVPTGATAAGLPLRSTASSKAPEAPDSSDESMCFVCTLGAALVQTSAPLHPVGPSLRFNLRPQTIPAPFVLESPFIGSQRERAPPTARA